MSLISAVANLMDFGGGAMDAPRFNREDLERKTDLDFDEAAFYLHLAKQTLYNSWRRRGLTAYEDHRGRVIFKRAELDHYLKTSRRRRA